MTIDEKRIAAIEARLSTLESNQPATAAAPLDPSKLSEPWANKQVKKLPSNWKHRDVVGAFYSDLSPQEAGALASFYEWKASKGRAETPVRLNNQGKPWHESDTFEAKILRTWEANPRSAGPRAGNGGYGRNGSGANAKHTMPPESAHDEDGVVEDDSSEIPF